MEEWEKSTSRRLRGGRVVGSGVELPRGAEGRNLCRWCELEVPRGRRTFCSEFCVEQWRLRTDPSYLRERTYARDRGVCFVCRVDTEEAYADIRRSRGTGRLRKLQHWGLKMLTRKSLWDADHIVPVVEGGGTCDLSNIRTLCLICHRKETADLRARRTVILTS
ncbi:MAG: HNH endonuclease signature motif containing protein [Bryobacteraceae bacterium]|nr:HNH endonuclease signature motif containing protein [Bryobacteraceae bacterium]